ncbi:hypothetical protein [Acetobacter sp.]
MRLFYRITCFSRIIRARDRQHSRVALPALAATTIMAAMLARPALAGDFSVTDGKADSEVSEVSRIYLDGKLVATFRLDDQRQERTVRIPTAEGQKQHTYTLCGEITVRTEQGKVETHEISSNGTLRDPDGHHFFALGSSGFTDFYLLDPTAPDIATHSPGRSDVCAAPIS